MNSTSSDDAVKQGGRNLELKVVRPAEARAFALLLFAVNWMLAHATVAYVVLAWKTDDTERILKYLAFVAITMVLIPQVRNTMPDAPGFDGVLIGKSSLFPYPIKENFKLKVLVLVFLLLYCIFPSSPHPSSLFLKFRRSRLGLQTASDSFPKCSLVDSASS